MKSKKMPWILLIPAVCFLLFAILVFVNVFRHRIPLPDSWVSGEAEGHTMAPAESLKVELNRATVEELATVPGIGQVLAQRIVDYRQAQGPFSRVEDLEAVSGIGAESVKGLREYLYVEGEL